MNKLFFAKFHLWKRSNTLLCMHLASALFGTKPINYHSSQKPSKTAGSPNLCPKRQGQEPIKIHPSQPMSSLPTMPPSISIHKEAVGGRSDGPTTHGALAKLLGTMTISANHMATWNQRHSRPMLVTNGTGGTSASSRLGRGFYASGIFRAPLHFNSEIIYKLTSHITVTRCHRSVWKAQLHENALQLLFQKVISQTPPLQVARFIEVHPEGEVPLMRSRFACLDELLVSLSPPSLEHTLRLDVIGLLGADSMSCHLLTEGHDEERRIKRMAFKSQAVRDCWWPSASEETTFQR